MKISLNWLKQYLRLDLDANKISEYLTDIGLEVEGIHEFEEIKGGLEGVIIGEVMTCIKHPNADRLKLTTVDIGEKEFIQIVCGAPNVDLGQKVLVASVGTILHKGNESFKIKKGKIRGKISMGMICSEDELNLGNDKEGIMVLPKDSIVGKLASDYFQIEKDTIFEIGLTPNRSDAMCHIGVARDLKAVLNHNGYKLEMCLPKIDSFIPENNNLSISVKIEEPDLCPRYSGVCISEISVKESPKWLQNRLKSIGVVPINNIVDITNYVLHETGQPLHAFDYKKIKGNQIIVKKQKNSTKFITLDEIEREIHNEDLMICNEEESMCFAGVFGGLESGVSNTTNSIFLESAYFNPISIRKTSKRHNLNTDASFRFERGCDPNNTLFALKRAALLIKEIAGGKISSEIFDFYPNNISSHAIELTYKNLDTLIGLKINRDMVKSILKDLEIKIVSETEFGLSLEVPCYRTDVTREVDIIEEILRIYGFNNIPISDKLNTSIQYSSDINNENIRNIVSDLLSNNGYSEIMNNSLTQLDYSSLIKDLSFSENVTLINPLSQELNTLRQSLIFSGLENISYNINRKNKDIKIYEFGKSYHHINGDNVENLHLMLLLTGNHTSQSWDSSNKKVNFFNLKKSVEHILFRLGIYDLESQVKSVSGISEGIIYKHKKDQIVCFGKVEKQLLNNFDIKQEVFYADFNWDKVLKILKNTKFKYSEISKFPTVKRDLSLLIDKNIQFKDLLQIALDTEKNILASVNLFDVYEGDNLPSGKKSYALSFILEDKTKTLSEKYIDRVMNKLIRAYETKIGAEVRTK